MPDKTVQEMANRVVERLAEVNNEREKLLATLEYLCSEGAEVPGNLASMSLPSRELENGSQRESVSIGDRKPDIRPDTFFGLSYHQAAKKYLQDLGHADHLESIFRAMARGGVNIGGVNPMDTLRATLTQNSTVFVRVGPGTFGLREFYPHIKTKEKPPKSKAKKRRRTKKVKKTADQPTRPRKRKGANVTDEGMNENKD